MRTESLIIGELKHSPNDIGFRFADCKIVYRMLPFVRSPGTYQRVSIGANAACKVALFCQDMQAVRCSHRSFLAFAISLPIADIVHKPICMRFNPLFTFLRGPHANPAIDKPLDNERSFVCDPTNTIKHKDEQNIELLRGGVFFY